MKVNILLSVCSGLVLFQLIVVAGPLDNWHWRNPLPNGNPQLSSQNLYGITFANGIFVAVGDSGVVSLSTDTTNWTQSTTATTSALNAITYGNNLFVSVGNSGAVESSTDGTNWVLGSSGTTASLEAVAYGNGIYMAVGTGGTIITSTDGINWTTQASGTTGDFGGVAYGNAGFMAINHNLANQIFFSQSGMTWTNYTLEPTGSGFNGETANHEIVTFANGVYLIGSFRSATSQSVNLYIFTSTDGNTWTTNFLGNFSTGDAGFAYNFFMSGNSNITAAASIPFLGVSFFLISTNTTTWATVYNVPSSTQQGNAGAFGNGTFVIVASRMGIGSIPPIWTSSDGLTWTNRAHAPFPPSGPTNTCTSIATNNGVYAVATPNSVIISTNDAFYALASNTPALSSVITASSGFIGVGSGGTIYQSTDGLSWTQRNSGTLNNLHGIAAGGGLLVAVGDSGAIQTSPSGSIWTSRTSGTSLPLNAVTYANGLFVAVGYLGTVLTSPDGISWSGQYSGTLSNLLSVVYGSAGFVAVGSGGTIVTSTDGINWFLQNSGKLSTLETVTFGNGYYLLAGDNGVVETSIDGHNWTPRNVGLTGGQYLYGNAFLNNRFDVVGSGGTIIESDTILPLFDIQIHLQSTTNWLTVFAPPGSSFHIQTTTNLVMPDWIDVASYSNASPITQWTNTAVSMGQHYYRAISP